jgi:hypothetical protein
VLVVLVPEVVMELVELDEEDDEDELLPLVLLTVMTGTCQKRTGPARCRPGRSFISPAA